MPRRLLPGSERLRRLWNSRFWILAAALGALTISTGVATIHDRTAQGITASLITQATAMHASALASARLERLALEAFAPVGPLALSPPSPTTGPVTIDALAQRQREGIACGCRDLLPARRFFHYSPVTDAFTASVVDADGARADAAEDSAVADLARAEARQPRGVSNASSRIIVDPGVADRAVVVLVQRDERGHPLAV